MCFRRVNTVKWVKTGFCTSSFYLLYQLSWFLESELSRALTTRIPRISSEGSRKRVTNPILRSLVRVCGFAVRKSPKKSCKVCKWRQISIPMASRERENEKLTISIGNHFFFIPKKCGMFVLVGWLEVKLFCTTKALFSHSIIRVFLV